MVERSGLTMMKKLLGRNVAFIQILFALICLSAGCTSQSGYQKTYQALSVTKETAVFIAKTAKNLYENEVIDDQDLARIKEAYEKVQKAQAILIQAQQDALDVDVDENRNRVQALTTVYLRVMTKFVELAVEIGILDQQDQRIQVGG